jgi:hypothetical protein
MSSNFSSRDSFFTNDFCWKNKDLQLLDVIKTISQASLLVWYEQETPTLKRQKLWLEVASRTKPTKAAVEMFCQK